MLKPASHIPVIDIAALIAGTDGRHGVAEQINEACRESGFFYITGHGVDEGVQKRLEDLSRQFFAQPVEKKQEIRMSLGGRAWRGYFAVGDELTSGKPDWKEGIYFGAELGDRHPLVLAGTPMHGRNLFPEDLPALRNVVLDYMKAMTALGHRLMEGIALSLGLEESYFADRYTREPLTLFRIFNYPPSQTNDDAIWGVGEHTDYGLLTILKQDDSRGLQVKSKSAWVDAPPLEDAFVCNIGDMLDRMTGGLYRSTPHRVKPSTRHNRLSFPFFFDPNFNAEVRAIELPAACARRDDKDERWDKASVHDFSGTYGDYLLKKVAKVFPQLRREVL